MIPRNPLIQSVNTSNAAKDFAIQSCMNEAKDSAGTAVTCCCNGAQHIGIDIHQHTLLKGLY